MVAKNIEIIRQRVGAACARARRSPEEITLIAVAKTFHSPSIRQALEAGVTDIGENYVQELRRKRDEFSDENIRWHFIGHLQSNKVKYIAPWIHCIHAVDSLSLGKEIAHQAGRIGRTLTIFVEVNTSDESSKFGVLPEKARNVVQQLSLLKNVDVAGLMTIGPFLPDPDSSRPSFRLLREIKTEVEREGMLLQHLSMGMTNDFEVAIEEGSTMIRIGTAIFGKRTKPISVNEH